MPTLSITFTTEQAKRIVDAYTDKLGLEVPATASDIKAALVAEIKSVVRGYEAVQAQKTIVTLPDVDLT